MFAIIVPSECARWAARPRSGLLVDVTDSPENGQVLLVDAAGMEARNSIHKSVFFDPA